MQIILGLGFLAAAILIVWFGRPEVGGWLSAAIQRWKAGGVAALLVTVFVAFGVILIVSGTSSVLR